MSRVPNHRPVFCARLLLAPLVLCGLASLTGCADSFSPTSPVNTPASASVHGGGTVHGGQQPIAGARIYLYAVSTTQTGQATSLLNGTGFILTDPNGNFSITGDYTCPANSYVYLLALGGNPGLQNATNPYIALGAGLGLCSSLTPSTFVTINEVTTVAMTSALASSAISETQIGSPFDLSVPFANIALLADRSSGFALPSSNNAVVPQAAINSLANSIAACVNSSGIGGPCSMLFADANVASGGSTPVDTFQAALNIAKNPLTNVAAIYSLAAADSVFAPTLPAAPASFDVAATNLNISTGCIPADANTYLMSTTRGDITLELRPDVAPQNVANFLAYVNNGSYTQSIIHRVVPDFVVQGGGYKYNSNGQIIAIPTLSPVISEPGLSNLRGTLAMALTGEPNTATNQFFFNQSDNPTLDTEEGGFTVFGQIVNIQGYNCFAADDSLLIIDAFQNFDTIVNEGSPFDSLPLVNYTSGAAIEPSNLEYVNAVTALTNVLTTPSTPTFQIGNTDPSTGATPVGISSITPGASIYYGIYQFTPPCSTMDGGYCQFDLQGQYALYTGPISLGENQLVYAYATSPNLPNISLYNGIDVYNPAVPPNEPIVEYPTLPKP